MKKKTLLTRREALITGATAIGGLLLGGCTKPLPPTYGNLLRMGDNLTYIAHRALLPGQSLAKEYSLSDISSFPATGTVNPADSSKPTFNKNYEKLMKTGFSDWRINIEGSVSNPQSFSLAELMKLPSRTQITRHTCEEGWTAIGQWTGVPLGHVLQVAGIKPSARFVNFFSYDGYGESIDLLDAFHPQTLLAYGMNGKQLTIPHGAPLRLRLEKQIGYKSLKYLEKIVVSDEFMDFGDSGWAWYVGI